MPRPRIESPAPLAVGQVWRRDRTGTPRRSPHVRVLQLPTEHGSRAHVLHCDLRGRPQLSASGQVRSSQINIDRFRPGWGGFELVGARCVRGSACIGEKVLPEVFDSERFLGAWIQLGQVLAGRAVCDECLSEVHPTSGRLTG